MPFYFWNQYNIYMCPRLPRLWLQTHVVPAQSYVGYQWATAEITALLQKIERWQFALVVNKVTLVLSPVGSRMGDNFVHVNHLPCHS